MSYSDVAVHQQMLRDSVRTRAYEEAIRHTVKPGQRVLDFGCGTGILSIFSARAGAEQIYAVDRSKFIRVARGIAERNGFDNIQFYHGEANQVELPGKVDIIVSEWMGHFLFFEQMLDPLIELRDKYLTTAGMMIPQSVTLHLGLVQDHTLHDELDYFRNQPYGIDFSLIDDWAFYVAKASKLTAEQLLPRTVEMGTLDLRTCPNTPETLSCRFQPTEAEKQTIYGLCGWFEAHLTDTVSFGTGPMDPPTHWRQMFFPLNRPFDLLPGREVRVSIVPRRDSKHEVTLWRWSIQQGDRRVEMDDFVHRTWLMRDLPPGRLP